MDRFFKVVNALCVVFLPLIIWLDVFKMTFSSLRAVFTSWAFAATNKLGITNPEAESRWSEIVDQVIDDTSAMVAMVAAYIIATITLIPLTLISIVCMSLGWKLRALDRGEVEK